MPISPEIYERILQAEKNQDLYFPNEQEAQKISTKIIVELVAPAAAGKNYVMDYAVKTHSDFFQITGFTTRDEDPRDVIGRYKYWKYTDESLSRLLDSIDKRQLIQYAVFPSTKQVYGSFAEDYPGELNVLDTQALAVEQIEKLPFKSITRAVLVTTKESYKAQFNNRYPDPTDPARAKKVQEGLISTHWSLSQDPKSIVWIENVYNDPGAAADRLYEAALHPQIDPQTHLREHLLGMQSFLQEIS